MKSFGPPRNHISGRDYTTAIRGCLLTDSRITHYIRRGFYGPEAQQRLLDAEKKKPSVSRAPKPSAYQSVLDFLA